MYVSLEAGLESQEDQEVCVQGRWPGSLDVLELRAE